MTKIYDSIDQLIGRTPLLKLKEQAQPENYIGNILLKLEYFNPAGSIKDRIGKAMIDAAEEAGVLKEGGTIIEGTSGNTGIGLASVGAARGYKVILTIPETMSIERQKILKAYGARIELTAGDGGMNSAMAKAKELAAEIPNSFIKGVSEKTHGFNRGMNRVSDAHFSTQFTDLVPPKILFQSHSLLFSK